MGKRLIEQVFLAFKVQIYDALGQTRLSGDITQGGATHSLTRNTFDGGIDELLTAFDPRRRSLAAFRCGCHAGIMP